MNVMDSSLWQTLDWWMGWFAILRCECGKGAIAWVMSASMAMIQPQATMYALALRMKFAVGSSSATTRRGGSGFKAMDEQ